MKASGLLVSLVLALAPTVVVWLQDQQSAGIMTTASVGLAVVIINAFVKALQVMQPPAQQQVQYDPDLIPGTRGADDAAPTKTNSKLAEFLFG